MANMRVCVYCASSRQCDPIYHQAAARLGRELALAGHTPTALLELGGWDATLASVAELLADPAVSGPAKAEFREVVRILARRWARGST